MVELVKCKWAETCGYELCVPEYCNEYEAVRINNGDRIRAMSNKELADYLGQHCLCSRVQTAGNWCDERAVCTGCLEEWLEQPMEE